MSRSPALPYDPAPVPNPVIVRVPVRFRPLRALKAATARGAGSARTATDPVFIYADESCLGNGRSGATPGGAAGIVQSWTDERWQRRDFWLSEPDTTNNRMAIRSAIAPLATLPSSGDIVFVSDSQYLVKGMSEWMAGWIRRGWRKAGQGGKPGATIENLELWQELVPVAARHRVEWRWVRGHAGTVMNEYANWLAIRAAREQTESDGLVTSRFESWLLEEQKRGRYLDHDPLGPPRRAP